MNQQGMVLILESQGISYHRVIANIAIEKINTINSCSTLIIGDNDLLISSLISSKYSIHAIADIQHISYPISSNSRIIIVDKDTFPIEEYDLVIYVFSDLNFIKENISKNFIYFPNLETTSEEIKLFFNSHSIAYTKSNINTGLFTQDIYYSNI